jgi:hypothetical protein
MASIVLLRPWMKGEEEAPKEGALPPDNMFLYVMPSMLDVLGTIVDTAGLYYVPCPPPRPAFR